MGVTRRVAQVKHTTIAKKNIVTSIEVNIEVTKSFAKAFVCSTVLYGSGKWEPDIGETGEGPPWSNRDSSLKGGKWQELASGKQMTRKVNQSGSTKKN